MRWPWDKTEHRQASGGAYSDAIVAAIVARAGGTSVGEPNSIAALEIASGLWSRAFASAELSTPIAAVSPSMLSSVGRELVRRGASVWAIGVRRGAIELRPAASWDIAGGSDPASWQYRLDMQGPSGSETRIYPSASILHFKYATDPETPWHGISPIGYARLSGKLAANLELRLAEEAGARVGYLLPIPGDGGDGGTDDSLSSFEKMIWPHSRENTALVENRVVWLGRGPCSGAAIGLEAATNGRGPARNARGTSRGGGARRAISMWRSAWVSVRPIRRDFAEGELEKIRAHDAGRRARCSSGIRREARPAGANAQLRGDGFRLIWPANRAP